MHKQGVREKTSNAVVKKISTGQAYFIRLSCAYFLDSWSFHVPPACACVLLNKTTGLISVERVFMLSSNYVKNRYIFRDGIFCIFTTNRLYD